MARPPMSNFWVHGGLLSFENRKMSKSLGNFEPLSALLDRHDPQAIRLLFLMTGYRKPMNFTEDNIAGATTALRRLYDAYDALREAPPRDGHAGASDRAERLRVRTYAALDDDMNTSAAASVLFEVAGSATEIVAAGEAAAVAGFMHEAMGILGLSPNERTLAKHAPELRDDIVAILNARFPDIVPLGAAPAASAAAMTHARDEARAARDFARADALRDALAEVGVTLTDTKEGTTWSVAG
jgi:cysteinyl-tRNA synthetase